MKKGLFLISLIVAILILLAGCQPGTTIVIANTVAGSTRAPSATHSSQVITNPSPLDNAVEPSCTNPTAALAQECAAMEQQILAATVRLELFHGANGGRGHGTIVAGRYLITHNHYPISAAALANGEESGVTAVSVFKANGDVILQEAPLSFFTVAAVYPQILVLDFGEYGGVGFFDSVGVPSAEFKAWESLPLQPGMEVAQVDWDGSTAFVKWVHIDDIVTVDGIPALELASFVTQGASGGGIFWKGYHIANNWSRATELSQDSETIIRQYSVAALDTLPPTLTSQMSHSYSLASIEVVTP